MKGTRLKYFIEANMLLFYGTNWFVIGFVIFLWNGNRIIHGGCFTVTKTNQVEQDLVLVFALIPWSQF